jgi:predicted phosphohydrolase
MRVVCISDTHELHRELTVPSGDLLIHSGDFTFFSGRRSIIADFDRWLGELRHQHKVVVYGNHESAFESSPSLRARLSNAVVMVNEWVIVAGVKLWGSPATMQEGPFGLSRAADRAALYATIPADTHILVTHARPTASSTEMSMRAVRN